MTLPFTKIFEPQNLALIRSIAVIVSMRVIAASLGMFYGILLARFLGAHNLGILAYISAIGGFFAVLSTLGFSQLLVRETAIHSSREEWDRLAGLLRFTTRTGLLTSVGLGALGALAALWVTRDIADKDFLWTFLVVMVGLPMGILIQFRQSVMRGLHHVTMGLFPEMVVRPALAILLLTASYFYLGQQLSAPQAVAIGLVAVLIALMLGSHLLRRAIPEAVKNAKPAQLGGTWLKCAFPLYLIAVIQFFNLQADVLMLGFLAPVEQVGFYTVAKSPTEAIIFVLVAAEFMVAPKIAQMYFLGELEKLQKILHKAAQFIAVTSIPIALILLFWGKWILSLYGEEFDQALLAFRILCVGQLINALSGPIGQLAIHTGHDKATTYVVAVAAVVNILFNWLLIPHYGAAGAAAGTAISLAVWNIGLLVYILVKTGLSPLAIPLPIRMSPR